MVLLLAGCLFDTATYERRTAELTDADGDGFAMKDDCDDDAAAVFPGAEERCDDVDQDCDGLADDEATDVTAWFADADGDGHGTRDTTQLGCNPPTGFVASDDDCDDTDAGTFPEAADAWYDGVDANCDGADDYDADGDGDPSDSWGGTDCDDVDPLVAGTLAEGWTDGGVDNDCDGSIEDQALVEVGSLGTRIDGAIENGAFGSTVLAVPAGWVDDEAVLLASGPFAATGVVYGWRASELAGGPTLASAPWQLAGHNEGDFFGAGLGWAGDESSPLVAIGSGGASGGRGLVEVWAGATLGAAPVFTIVGETAEAAFGIEVISGYDHDGDGLSDIVTTAVVDSRVAPNAGAAFVFLGADSLTGDVPASAADIEFTTTYAAAWLAVSSVGDTDGDGLEDLGFDLSVAFETGPGGLLVSGGLASGSFDAQEVSFAQLYAAGNAFSKVADWNGDGAGELLVASGGLERYLLPLSGVVTPWDDAASRLAFTSPSNTVTALRSDMDQCAGHHCFLLASSVFEGSRGGLFFHTPYWPETMAAEGSRFALVGEAAGDALGADSDLIDTDRDGLEDLVVGAPGSDAGGAGSGAVYVIPAAQ